MGAVVLASSSSLFLPSERTYGADFSPARSGSIAVTPDGNYLVVVNPDSDSISILVLPSRRLVAEIAVGRNPQTVSIDSTGRQAYVANRDDDTVSAVNLNMRREVAVLPVGDEPFAVLAGVSSTIFVTNMGSNSLSLLDAVTFQEIGWIPTEIAPRGLALATDGMLYVTHFFSGKLTVFNPRTRTTETVISTGLDANISQGIFVDPATRLAYLPQTRSNVTNRALLFDSTVFPIVSVIDLTTRENLLRRRVALDIADRPVSLPLDVLVTGSGYLCVLNAGSNDLSVISLRSGSAAAHLQLGNNPRGMALGSDGTTLYISNSLGGTVSVVDTQTLSVTDEIRVTDIPLTSDVLNGKILFNTSARPELARDRWIACATCHFDGGMDGRTWFFRDGPRNTPSLLGIKDTLPMHWSGDLDELQDVEATVRNIQAGTGLADGPMNCDPACDQGPPNTGRSKDLDDLAAYMRSLRFGTNPNFSAGSGLTEAAQRGQKIFLDSRTRCATCHPAPLYTDRQKHDVGTATSPLEAKGGLFDTPSLRGLYQTAPYLHDGSASSLSDLLTTANPKDQHGNTSHLSSQERANLVEFLLSLRFEQPAGWLERHRFPKP